MLLAQIINPAVPTFGSNAAAPAVSFTLIIVTVWRTAVTLGGLALLVMLILGAFEWITAGGEKGKIQSAKDRITQSIIGMLVLVGTVAISIFIGTALGINLLQPTFIDNLKTGGFGSGSNNPGCVINGQGC
ncbi:MAG TPA: hypothetical protein VLH19_04475 [Patescibacteria group bacterium]|nr:hypothetical protein [Patescibacteria group bacterium]